MTARVSPITIVATIGLLFTSPIQRSLLAQDLRALGSAAVERQLAPGQQHEYAIALKSGEYANVTVDQRGVDVVVETRGTDGKPIASFQDEVGIRGIEQVEVVADASGTYTLVLRAADGTLATGAYLVRLGERRHATAADRSMQDARRLRTSAARLYDLGRTEEARPLIERAMRLTELARGPGGPQVAAVAAELAAVYMDLPDFPNAEVQYRRAIEILERTRGPEDATTAFVKSRLATLYRLTDQRPKAEALLRTATEVVERSLGNDHLWYVRCLASLAGLRNDAGDYDKAEEILQREKAILEKLRVADSILYAGVLNNLGEVYGRKRAYDRAEDYLRRAVEIAERVRSADDYFVSNPLVNLGIIARERKDYRTAEAYDLRALAIRQRVVGPDHSKLFLILNNLANIYHATGDYPRSLETHRRALRIAERTFGPYHHNTLLSVGNIARVSAAMGETQAAIAFQRRADAIIERQLALNLAVGSERQKLAFVDSIAERTDRTISLHLDRAPDSPDAAALAATVVLQRKGRVLDAMLDISIMRQRLVNVRDRALLDRLHTTMTDLAGVALHAADPDAADARRRTIQELESRKERLEAELSERSAEFRVHTLPVTLEAIQAAIPDDAVLVEYSVYRSFDPAAERNIDAYGPPRYAAYLVHKTGVPRGFDLGDVADIDDRIEKLREALNDPSRRDVERHARDVDDLVMRPLRASFGDSTRCLISPDGALNLLPFEALVDEHGRYLLERYAISYLTTGRDLLRMHDTRANPNPPILFADPLFGEPDADAAGTRRGSRPSAALHGRLVRRSVTSANDVSTVYFAPLPASAGEAKAIKNLFPDARLFMGAAASKEALLHADAPRILHIASHGFFLQQDSDASVHVDNPLLRSGLALAGANLTRDSRRDGLLTALEASGLNLWGTQLVTLSACDTGVGQIRNGEGVYGLRRAFVLAGTQTLVMSLWPVSDGVAREMMVAYYVRLRAGIGRGDALRQAKIDLLNQPRRRHPYYWASFIQSGEWTSLDGVH